MHVMDTECEKIGGGGCLAAESAPELATKPSESLLVVDDVKTSSSSEHIVKVQESPAENENNLVNGTSGDHCTTIATCGGDGGVVGSTPAMLIDETAKQEMEVEVEGDDDDEEEEDPSDAAAVESSSAGVLNAVEDGLEIDDDEEEEMDVDIVIEKGTKENTEQADEEEEQVEEESNEEELLAGGGEDEEELDDDEEEGVLDEEIKDGQQISLPSSTVALTASSAMIEVKTIGNGTVSGGRDDNASVVSDVVISAGKEVEEPGIVEEEDETDEVQAEQEEELVDNAGGNIIGKEVFGNVEEQDDDDEEEEEEEMPEEEIGQAPDFQDLVATNNKNVMGNSNVTIELTKEKSSPLSPPPSTATPIGLQQQKQLQPPVAAAAVASVVLVPQPQLQQSSSSSPPVPATPPSQSLLSSALTTTSTTTSSSSSSLTTTITIESSPVLAPPPLPPPPIRKERLIIIDDAKVTNLKVESIKSSTNTAVSSISYSSAISPPIVSASPLSLLAAAVTANKEVRQDTTTISTAASGSSGASSGAAIVIPINEDDDNRTSIRAAAFSIASKLHCQKEAEKRKIAGLSEKETEGEVSSGSESDTSRKKIKVEPDLETGTAINSNNNINSNEQQHATPPSRSDQPLQQHIVDDDRERYIQEFIAQCSQNVEEMDRAAERLHKEVETLVELARAKELEWNAIVRVRKMREEMLERLLRKRRLATEDFVIERTHLENSLNKNVNKCQGNNQLMMVPIVSSSPGAMINNRGPPPVRLPEYGKQQRPILPKPYANMVDPNCTTREGRNGPIVDVKSIIADYRSRHPESVPRRGRRMRGGPIIEPPPNRMSANPSLISMANMALGSGASIRTVNESPYNLSQDHSRPSSTDPTRGGPIEGGGNMGYKDVLVQFAKMTSHSGVHGSKGPPPNGIQQPPPPPPYPEVTLHPVSRPGSSPPTPASSSLLHGILTKSNNAMSPAAVAAAAAATRPPANFSPTLARLLTAPDRPPHPIQPPPHFRPQHPPRVSIADILSSSKKSRNEITITPVSGNPTINKPKEDVVLLQDDDEAEGSDRLVIDESPDNEEIPQCQGCRQKPAQFVCAGCGNQWYCSRECQVTAWEEHSDVCSG